MGNTCCNKADKDPNAVDYQSKPQTRKNGEEQVDDMDPDLLKRAGENEDKIVKLQAQTRGFLARKQLNNEKGESYDKNKPKQSSRTSQRNKDGGPGTAVAKPVARLPDYSNPATKATEEKLGAFNYDRDGASQSNNEPQLELIERQPYELDNGAIYKG